MIKLTWEFVFLGANIDAAAEANRIGISADRFARYCCSPTGIADSYDAFNDILRLFTNDQTDEIGQRLDKLNRNAAEQEKPKTQGKMSPDRRPYPITNVV